jgi:hypothetical protein
MAEIHQTTLTPTKLELLASWLPAQPWYSGTGREPELAKAGGFRLDDPAGEVGIEFMVVTDGSGDRPRSYHVPLTYRGAPLDGAGEALIGTAEHGVLGRRWIYDGTHDPVLIAQLLAVLRGGAEPQAQSTSNTPDPSVTAHLAGDGGFSTAIGSKEILTGPHGTDVVVETTAEAGAASRLTLHIVRVLETDAQTSPDSRGHITAGWQPPGAGKSRGPFVVLHDGAS